MSEQMAPLPTSLKGLHRIIEFQAKKIKNQQSQLHFLELAQKKDYVNMTGWQGFKFFLNCVRYKKKYDRN